MRTCGLPVGCITCYTGMLGMRYVHDKHLCNVCYGMLCTSACVYYYPLHLVHATLCNYVLNCG